MKKMRFNLKKQIIIFTLICIIVSFLISSFNKNSYAASTNGQMMAHASTARNGSTAAGDQGTEVLVSPYTPGFFNYIFRYQGDNAEDESETLADIAIKATENQNVGYTYGGTAFFTLIKGNKYDHDVEKIDTPADADCSAFVSACLVSTGYACNIEAFKGLLRMTTATLITTLPSIGFTRVTDGCQKGDILVREGVSDAHTAIYVGDATASASSSSSSGGSSTKLSSQEISAFYQNAVDLDASDFDYNGYPKDITIIEKRASIDIIDSIKHIANYILGILVSGIRMAIVGYAEAFERFINDTLLKIEGTEKSENQAEYSIEDLLYNRIPALDVNIFSNSPGGKKLNENSVLATIRKLVAGWYYSIRNIVAVILFIILLYTGLQIAISTSAEKKANYSERLINWLKCMVLLFIIHYLIIFILNANNIIVTLFAKTASKANVLHDTIEARAYDVRFTVGITGMIMYVTLVIYWVRFILLYFRRYVYNIIYIVLAPFSIMRYAIDSSNAKGKAGFESWLNKFVSNIIIQPAHALAYTLFMGIATDIAMESIGGFIIALVFMSQILKMDEYVLSIIKFNGKDAGEHLRKMKKPIKEDWPSTIYAGARLYGQAAINTGTLVSGIARPIKNSIKYRNYNRPGKTKFIDRALNKHNEKQIERALKIINMDKMTEDEKLANPKLAKKRDQEIEEMQREIELKKIKISARNNNPEAKKVLKLRRENRKQVFTASVGALKNVLGSVGGATMALPLGVAVSPEVGIAATKMISSPSKHIGNYRKIKKKEKTISDNNENINETIILVNQARETLTEMNGIIKTYDADNIEDIKKELRRVNRVNANASSIRRMLNYEKNVGKNVPINKTVRQVINKIDKTQELTEMQKEKLEEKETELIENMQKDDARQNDYNKEENKNESENHYNYGKPFTFKNIGDKDIEEIANKFSDDVTKEIVSPANFELAKRINKMKDINDRIKSKNGKNSAQIDIEKEISKFGH